MLNRSITSSLTANNAIAKRIQSKTTLIKSVRKLFNSPGGSLYCTPSTCHTPGMAHAISLSKKDYNTPTNIIAVHTQNKRVAALALVDMTNHYKFKGPVSPEMDINMGRVITSQLQSGCGRKGKGYVKLIIS